VKDEVLEVSIEEPETDIEDDEDQRLDTSVVYKFRFYI
jgi:hypothetical protein